MNQLLSGLICVTIKTHRRIHAAYDNHPTTKRHIDDIYPGFWLHPPDKYEGDPHVKIIEQDVPDLAAAQSETRRLLGRLYSYHGCLEAAAKLTGFDLPVDGECTVMCSEAVTRILRAGGLCVCPDSLADDVTPVMLYEDLVKHRGGVLV